MREEGGEEEVDLALFFFRELFHQDGKKFHNYEVVVVDVVGLMLQNETSLIIYSRVMEGKNGRPTTTLVTADGVNKFKCTCIN